MVTRAALAALWCTLLRLSLTCDAASAESLKRELTPADAIATVRLMPNQARPGAVPEPLESPDGRRYVVRLAYGDPRRNGIWMDIMTGSLASLTAAAHPLRCAHLFTTGLGSASDTEVTNYDAMPSSVLQWVGPHSVAFLWSDAHLARQVLLLDLESCKLRPLTHSATSVYGFAMTADGAMLFDAEQQHALARSALLWRRGFTVADASDGWSILSGNITGASVIDVTSNNSWFVRTTDGITRPLAIEGETVDKTVPLFRPIALSQDGRFAVTPIGLWTIPADWQRYTSARLQSELAVNADDPHRLPQRYELIDLLTKRSRPLWPAAMGSRSQLAWSPGSDAVAIAPTFLPPDTKDPRGLSGAAAVSLNVHSGSYAVMPVDLTDRTVTNLRWLSPTQIELGTTHTDGSGLRVEQFERRDDIWHTVTKPVPPPPISTPRVRVEIRQSLNEPPRLFAIDGQSGAGRLILDPNPHLLEQFRLGRTERLSGTLPDGHPWLGQLIYPADYVPGRRYPLLIQSLYARPWGPEEYTLDGTWGDSGMGLGPSGVPSYPGQLLATRNVAVLEFELLQYSRGAEQAHDHQLAFEAIANQLTASGLADPHRIALAGFSRNGYWVEYTLAHSTFPFAAAVAADNYDPSYFQSALANWREYDAQINGAPAFGAGMQTWLGQTPGFNAEHIHTPLRIVGQSMGGVSIIIAEWEIFSRLRHLQRPVEMYVMPDINEHPSHSPQNPRQVMAVQSGTVDWFDFWLNDHEDPSPDKADQYTRWRRFRASQAAAHP